MTSAISHTVVDRVAGLYVSGPNGALVASAGQDLNIVARLVGDAGSGATGLSAGNTFTKTGEQTASHAMLQPPELRQHANRPEHDLRWWQL